MFQEESVKTLPNKIEAILKRELTMKHFSSKVVSCKKNANNSNTKFQTDDNMENDFILIEEALTGHFLFKDLSKDIM
jgi:hypothetical protein